MPIGMCPVVWPLATDPRRPVPLPTHTHLALALRYILMNMTFSELRGLAMNGSLDAAAMAEAEPHHCAFLAARVLS